MTWTKIPPEDAWRCPARIRPTEAIGVIACLEPDGHGPQHQGVIADFAYPGSRTRLTWLDSDRRNFTGDWIKCPHGSCLLPANHRGDHAS